MTDLDAERNRENSRAYRRTQKGYNKKLENYMRGRQFDINSGCKFTEDEDLQILKHDITDFELAKILGRSVQSIQVRRSRLNKFIGETYDSK